MPYKFAIETVIGIVPLTFICSAHTRREVVVYSVYMRGRSLEDIFLLQNVILLGTMLVGYVFFIKCHCLIIL